MFAINPCVSATEAAPIAEASTWLDERRGARRLISLSQAVPSYPPADSLQNEIARLSHLSTTGLYTDILGIPELRAATATHLSQDYGADVAPENIAVISGANQGFCLALMAIAATGDNVVLPVPYFFNHFMWLQMLGVEPRFIACGEDMLPDPAAAARMVDKRTKAIVLVTPNNPTGAIYPPALIEQFQSLAEANSIALIVDETYKDFRLSATPAHGLFSLPKWHETLVHLFSFSKSFSMTGYRVGTIAASTDLLAEIEKLMDCVAICAPHISQGAALFALQNLSTWRTQKTAQMAERAVAMSEAFRTPGLAYELRSCGAFFAYVRHPFDNLPAREVAISLAKHQDLLVLPGSMFGPGQERYLRVAFANAEMDEILDIPPRLVESQMSMLSRT